MLLLIGWMRRPTLLGGKLEECRACGVVGPHFLLRTTHWFTLFRFPVLLLWMKHGLLCPQCGDYQGLGFLQVRRAFKEGRLPLSRTRPAFEAAVREGAGPRQDDLAAFGLAAGADQDQIKARWRDLAKQAHPDSGGDTSRFIELQAAYQRLSTARAGGGAIPSAGEFFDPVIQNPKRGFFDGYLKVWTVAAAALLIISAVTPRTITPTTVPGRGGTTFTSPANPVVPIVPAGVTGTAHSCWTTADGINGCQDDTSTAMLFGSRIGTFHTCYFVEPLLEGEYASCR